MKVGLITVAYREERFIKKFLEHVPHWVDKKIALISEKPWFGEEVPEDRTLKLATAGGAVPILSTWENEESQRNTGVSLLEDCDWVLVLDPDEATLSRDWNKLYEFLETAEGDAYVCEKQITYYKDGIIDPPEEYRQIIAVRPWVKFVDKRVVSTSYGIAPVTLHHFSWRRSDSEIWNKITHYAHAPEFNKEKWFNEVWLADKRENVHPLTPEALKRVIPAELPRELKEKGYD